MIGIRSYGAYIPWYRINRKVMYSSVGWLEKTTFLPGEKAAANFDEDVVTMAVAACRDCLSEIDREEIDGLYFASVTMPYEQRQNAGIIATALNLRSDVYTADFSGSLKAGTTALISAYNSVKAGSLRNVLVCVSGYCTGKPGSPQEVIYGDGSAALLISNKNVVANIEGFYSVSYDFVDHWRGRGENFDHAWEDRWIRDMGYGRFINEAITGLTKKYELAPQDIAKVAYPCLHLSVHKEIGIKLELKPDQIQDHMVDKIGNTGVAYPLMLLVAMLEDAKPDDRIITAGYGNGSDALLFHVTEEIEEIRNKKRGIKKHLASKRNLDSYERYISYRNILTTEKGIRGEQAPPVPFSVLWRHRKEILALCGSKCKRCGTPQYPSQHVCVNPNCRSIDEMEEYCFADKKGYLFSYTEDHLAYSPVPPLFYGMVNFEGGGRFIFEITDCEPGTLKVGMPVEMSFRKKYLGETTSYFWKASPREYLTR